LCIYEIQNIILGTTILWIFHWLEHQGMAKKTFKDVAATLWKMPGQRAKVKITKNKSMENCKFV
jgi:hypothetical protein